MRLSGSARWLRGIAALFLVLSLVAVAFTASRTYRTFDLLMSARDLGRPEISSIRGWMTLRYLSETYGAEPAALCQALELAPDSPVSLSLRDIASAKSVSVLEEVKRAQSALAGLVSPPEETSGSGSQEGWFVSLADEVMSGVLRYGYPVLLAAVVLGSLGFPVPAGPVAAFAGSLAAAGSLNGAAAFITAMLGSLAGDVLAYAIGRTANPVWLAKWGRWIGYTEDSRIRAQTFFSRWGGVAVVLSMSAVSQISSVTGLLAGVSRWSLARYIAFAAAGRILWTLGYFGLGYAVGSNFAAASGFLYSLGLLVLSLAAAALLLRVAISARFSAA